MVCDIISKLTSVFERVELTLIYYEGVLGRAVVKAAVDSHIQLSLQLNRLGDTTNRP